MKIIVGQHKLEIVKEPVNEREIDISKCEFEFDEAITSEYVKEAYFTLEGNTYKQIILNDECDIPSEVLVKKGTVEIGVVAFLVENEEEIKRYNPSPAYFNTWVGSLKDNAENSEPVTPTDKEQMEQTLQEGLNSIDNKLGEVDDKMLVVDGKIEDIDTAITQTNNLNIDVNKVDKTTQVDLTKKDGTTNTVYINDGTSLQFMWQGTSLGIKTDDMEQYVFVNLQGIQGQPGPQGEPFRIKKEYTSVAEMNADFDNMNVGDYVMIASTVEVEDNAKLYVKGDSQWIFITDFSGAQGIKGETGATPIIRIGTVTSGSTPSVTISGTAEEPVFNFVLQPGEQGRTGETGATGPTGNGIASIIKTASAGLIDTYTITFTDGTTSTFEITNGADGGVTQEYVDEHDDQLRTLFNVLPKVSDSGESVTLNNTGDTMLYKVDLKGNTSQEVIQGEVGLEEEDTSIYVDDVNESKENYITLKGNTSQSILPSGYTQVDYIESTGTQYIDTGYTPVQNDEFEIKNITSNVNNNGVIISAGSGTYQLIILSQPKDTYYKYFAAGNAARFSQNGYNNNTIVINKDGKIYVDGKLKATSSYGGDVNSSLNIFKRANGTAYFVGRIGELIITNNNVKKRHFIPCYRNSDNVVGMYDLVSNTFYTNSGAGNFTYGSTVPTPDSPQEIEVVTGLNNIVISNDDNTENTTYEVNLGKNLFDKNSINSGYIILADGTLEERNTAFYSNYISVMPNTEYAISGKTGWSNTALYDKNKNFISRVGDGSNYFTTPENAYFIRTNGLLADLNSIQIEKGDKATSYAPYFTPIELCKIGTYQDRIYKSTIDNNWYVHKEIGKVVLNGSESGWVRNYYRPLYQIAINNIMQLPSSSTKGSVLSNNFSPVAPDVIWNTNINGITNLNNADLIRIRFQGDIYPTLEDFKTWLSTHNTALYYILATPTDTQITDTTLVNQLNALYNATIYSTTHINTETSNLLPYIDLKYNVVTASPSPEKASEVEVVTGNNTITISNEDGTKTQSYNITLGNLELCKIGDYQDYFYKDNGNWYKYGAIAKTTDVVGSTSITINDMVNNGGMYSFYGGTLSGKTITYDSALLRQNTIYYPLATPTTTQITDQLLVSQLDELQKAMSYYDKTIITQTNADKPFILDVVGIRDLQDIFNL